MIDCTRFLLEYSDFRDELVDSELRAKFLDHIESCASCARYDRVVGRGVSLLRELPEPVPSDDFGARLQHRLFHVDDEMRRVRTFPRSGFAVAATAVILLLVSLSPLIRAGTPLTELPAVVANAPSTTAETPALLRSGPFLTPTPASTGSPARSSLLGQAPPSSPWLTSGAVGSPRGILTAID